MSLESDIQSYQRSVNDQVEKVALLESDVAKEKSELASLQSKLADLQKQQADQTAKEAANNPQSTGGGIFG